MFLVSPYQAYILLWKSNIFSEIFPFPPNHNTKELLKQIKQSIQLLSHDFTSHLLYDYKDNYIALIFALILLRQNSIPTILYKKTTTLQDMENLFLHRSIIQNKKDKNYIQFVKSTLTHFRFSNIIIKKTIALLENISVLPYLMRKKDMQSKSVLRFSAKRLRIFAAIAYTKENALLSLLLLFSCNNAWNTSPHKKEHNDLIKKCYYSLLSNKECFFFDIKDIDMNGSDVLSLTNKKSGKWLGDIKKTLFRMILINPSKNNKEILIKQTRIFLRKISH